jgi:hypothetical protein
MFRLRTGKSKKSKKRIKTSHSRISEESASSRVPQWLEKNDVHQATPSRRFDVTKSVDRNIYNNNNNDLFDDGDDMDEEDYLGEGEQGLNYKILRTCKVLQMDIF